MDRMLRWAEMPEIASATDSIEQRAQALLETVRRVVPYAAAWIAVRHPETRVHRPVGQAGDTAALARYFTLSADHLAAVVVVHPAGDLSGLGLRDLRVLGGLLQGWDAERVGTSCAVPSVQRHLDRLTRRLAFASPRAFLVHVAREGLYIPPPLWP